MIAITFSVQPTQFPLTDLHSKDTDFYGGRTGRNFHVIFVLCSKGS